MKNLKLQWLDKVPPPEERNPELFYYDIRNSDIDDGYTIERGVLVTNKDILKDKELITDKELENLHYEEVQDLYVKHNSIESDIELE